MRKLKQGIAYILCVVLLCALLPVLPASATGTVIINPGLPLKYSDPSTHLSTNRPTVSTEYDGKLWVDKSVSATDEICSNMTTDLADDEFEVVLSAMSQTYPIETITTQTHKKANVVMAFDLSSSMVNNYMTEGDSTKSRLKILREVGQQFINSLSSLGNDYTINLSIVTYAGQAFISQSWIELNATTAPTLMDNIKNIEAPTVSNFSGASSMGNTNSQAGAYMARLLYSDEYATQLNRPANYADTTTHNFIIFMTDGAPNRYYTAGTAEIGSIPVSYNATKDTYYTSGSGISRVISGTDYKREAAYRLLEQAEAMRTIPNATVFSLGLGEWFVDENESSGFPTATYLCQLFAGVANGTRSAATGEVLTADYALEHYLGYDVPDGAMAGKNPIFPNIEESAANFYDSATQKYKYTLRSGYTWYFDTMQDMLDAMNLVNPTDTFVDASSGQTVQKQTAFYYSVENSTASRAAANYTTVDDCGVQALPNDLLTQIVYYYAGNTATKFSTSMQDIITAISTSFANYTTSTVATDDPNADGLITFYDHMGEGMQMRSFLGVEFSRQVYSGANFARRMLSGATLSADEEALMNNWCTAFSRVYATEFTRADARTLLNTSAAGGSLYYNSDTDFSNELAWYATYTPATGNFIYQGPYYNLDGTIATPPATATHTIFQYCVLEAQTLENSILISEETSLMFLHMENVVELATGRETVIFRIPAALIPIRTVMTSNGVAHLESDADPLSMIFTVGMRGDISPEMLDDHAGTDAENNPIYTFYTNAWKPQQELLLDDYGTTRAIFTANNLNPYYRTQTDEPLYVADAGAASGYRQATQADTGTLYLLVKWNNTNGAQEEYRPAARYFDVAQATPITDENGTFLYIPENTLRYDSVLEAAELKTENAQTSNVTQTNEYSYQSSFSTDQRGETVARARLGNNGKLLLGETTFEDYYVVDYGLPIHANPDGFELVSTNGKLALYSAQSGGGSDSYSLNELQLAHGRALLENKRLMYYPETTNFDGIDSIALRGISRYENRTAVCVGNIHMIPATNVTYEENFLSFTDADGATWSPTGTPTDAEQNKANLLYGYDVAYADNATVPDSLGNAMVATVSDPYIQPKAEFTFTGTGFDLLSRTSADSGVMLVEVRAENAQGTLQKVLIIDNYLNADTLYQLPVVHHSCSYGTYHVRVIGYYNTAFDHQLGTRAVMTEEKLRTLLGYAPEIPLEYTAAADAPATDKRAPAAAVAGQYKVYIDGIRIYNPLGQTITAADTVPYHAYTVANELNPSYEQIREHLLGATSWGDTAATSIGGAVYIAGTGSEAGPGELASHTGIYLGSSGRIKTDAEGALLDVDGNRMTFTVNEVAYDLYYYSGAVTETVTDGVKVYTDENGNEIPSRIYYLLPDPPVEGEEQTYTTVYLTKAEEKTLQLCFYDDVYATEGPQNEVYLRNGQAIAFTVGAGDYVQLSAKSPNGKTVELCLFDTVQSQWVQVQSISSATEQFFDVTPYIHDGVVIVKCNAAESDAFLSLVHAKLTNAAGEPSRMSSDLSLVYSAQRALAIDATIVPDHLHRYTQETVLAATCTTDGVGRRVCDCGESEEYVIPAVGHQETYTVTAAPTCTQAGLGQSACSVCGETHTQAIAALGHDYDSVLLREADSKHNAEILCTCVRCSSEYLLNGELSFNSVCSSYADIPDNWAREGITYTIANNLMKGIDDERFSPDSPMTRAMLVTVLYRMEYEPGCSGVHPFADVSQGMFYSEAVSWAYDKEIINGVAPDRFDPNTPLTREQIAAVLFRYCAYIGCDITQAADLSGYADADEIHAYAKAPIAWAVNAGLLNGTSSDTLSPRQIGTRAQVAAQLLRMKSLTRE